MKPQTIVAILSLAITTLGISVPQDEYSPEAAGDAPVSARLVQPMPSHHSHVAMELPDSPEKPAEYLARRNFRWHKQKGHHKHKHCKDAEGRAHKHHCHDRHKPPQEDLTHDATNDGQPLSEGKTAFSLPEDPI